ncbi:MAG: hypothetical protein GY950_12130 [bacterium]|nr:hypothetical protein [bacterium]
MIVIVILVIVIIAPTFFYKKEVNDNPLPSYYKKGVYHMHSVFSDGKGTIDEITESAAAVSNLDFVILTDHGRPNRKSSRATAYSDGVLLMGGSEFSLHSGHLACVGYETPDYIFPPEPQEAIDEMNRDKGVSFISHPFDGRIPWTDWEVSGYTGIEVLSCYSSARKISLLKFAGFPLQYLVNSNYALLSTLHYPSENMEKWDRLNGGDNSGRYYGIYALDAHARLPITENFSLNFPTYKAMFEILTVYVKIDRSLVNDARQDTAVIVSALRKGNFFNVIEAIGSANGFEAVFLGASGERVEMGGRTAEESGRLILELPFEFETEVVVKRDGKRFRGITKNKPGKLEIAVTERGVYVVEVYAAGNKFDTLPWILSNPFFIGSGGENPVGKTGEVEIPTGKPFATEKGFFIVETNPGSEGAVTYGVSEAEELVTEFTFKLGKDSVSGRDFWSVLAARGRFDFSGFKGIMFEARSDKRRRFWVEFRTGKKGAESWYRHSFLVENEWKRFYIPFERFHVIFGEAKAPDLSDIGSIFFSINNANAYEGTAGKMDLKKVELY